MLLKNKYGLRGSPAWPTECTLCMYVCKLNGVDGNMTDKVAGLEKPQDTGHAGCSFGPVASVLSFSTDEATECRGT